MLGWKRGSEQRAIVRTGRGVSMQRRESGKGSHCCFERVSMGSSIASSVGAPFIRGAAATPAPTATRVGEQLLSRWAQRAVLPCRRAGCFCEVRLFAAITLANWRAVPAGCGAVLPVCVRLSA